MNENEKNEGYSKKMTNEEFKKYCLEEGFHEPILICKKCGRLYYYHCFECDPDFLSASNIS